MMQPKLAKKIEKLTRKEYPEGIEAHGTDALRFTLTSVATTGRDISWDMKRLEGYRNFTNKLWNASRYVMMNTEEFDCGKASENGESAEMELSLADRWIIGQFEQTVKTVHEAFDTYRFDLASQALYEFTWNQFCDWYLELTKPVLFKGNEAQQRGTRHTLVNVLEALLRLMHPIMPFITETIWQRVQPLSDYQIKNGKTEDSIMVQAFPQFDESKCDQQSIDDLEWVKQFIIAIRNIRGEMDISPSKELPVLLKNVNDNDQRRLDENEQFLSSLAKLESITVLADDEQGPASASAVVGDLSVLIPMAGLIDKEAELARLDKAIEKLEKEAGRVRGKLGNENFVSKAPAAVIEKEQAKLADAESTLAKILEQKVQIAAL